MVKRSFAGLLAGICVLSSASVLPGSAVAAEGENSYSTKVSVDFSGEKKSISPYIYGVNAFDTSSLKKVTVNNIRQGGNRFTGYNWETNWSNAGEDWHNSSDTNQGDLSDGPAGAVRKFSAMAADKNIPYKLVTLQMAGYVAADKAGDVSAAETAPSKRWNEVVFKKDGELSLEPDLTDDKVYMDEYVNYIVNKLGNSKSETGIQGYSLDNEPVLWNDTHPYLHPEEVSSTELITKSIELAKVVKEIDPNAEVFGPAFWGMLPCMNCGDGSEIKDKATGAVTGTFEDKDWQAVKSNYFWFLDYYLESMAKAEKDAGKRLLDVIDVHYYSQGLNSDSDILQAARSLYDPEYEENSWLMPWGKQYFPFLANLKKSVDKYYPGTKIAISEYNLGNIANEKVTGKMIHSGIAEAEALGAFADNDVYFATYWGTLSTAPFVESAINLYTNYDGKGSSFGDTLLKTSTEDLSKSYAYAAINGDDDSKVTVVLGNKDETKSEKATIDLSGAKSKYKSATVYAVTQEDSGIRVISIDNAVKDNKVTVEIPALSFAQVVLSDKESDAEISVPPVINETEVKYNFADLEMSPNKVPMIPLENKKLKRIIINCTASSSTGSAWYCGGGGLCFNKLVGTDGSNYGWGNKSFSYNGSGDVEVEMDGTFTIPDPDNKDKNLEVKATYNDTYIEFQDWWKSSANSSSGEDVSVTYNTITLVYDNDGAVEPSSEEPVTDTTEEVFKPNGDANCDGGVDMSDVVIVMQACLNPAKYGVNGTSEDKIKDEGVQNGDVNKNGLDITDALAIQKFILKIITKFE